jgi:hypothetical protein
VAAGFVRVAAVAGPGTGVAAATGGFGFTVGCTMAISAGVAGGKVSGA